MSQAQKSRSEVRTELGKNVSNSYCTLAGKSTSLMSEDARNYERSMRIVPSIIARLGRQ